MEQQSKFISNKDYMVNSLSADIEDFVCFGNMSQAFEKALFSILFLSDVVLQLSMLFFKIGFLSMIVFLLYGDSDYLIVRLVIR